MDNELRSKAAEIILSLDNAALFTSREKIMALPDNEIAELLNSAVWSIRANNSKFNPFPTITPLNPNIYNPITYGVGTGLPQILCSSIEAVGSELRIN